MSGIAPSRYVVGAALDPALRALDDVGGRQTLVQRFGDLEPLQGEHLLHALAQAASGRFMIPLQKSRQLLQTFLTFFGAVHFPGGPHQVQRLALLLFGQFVEDVAKFVVAAALHMLSPSEHFVDGLRARLSRRR